MTQSSLFLTGIIVLAVFGIAQGDEPPTEKSAWRVVEGRVVDDHRVPIGGALVLLRPSFSVPFAEEGTARTDAEGRYHLDLTKAGWGPSKLQSMVLATGFAFAMGTVEAGSGQAIADFTLKAEAWKTTEVRLADRSGKPGAGVELTCSVAGNITWSRPKTDAEGRCRIAMAIGQRINIQAKPAGARPLTVTFMNAKDDPTTIALPLLEPIRGRVHDAEGRPLPRVTVGRSIEMLEGKPRVHPHRYSKTVTTDAEGRFALASTVMISEYDLVRPDRYRFPPAICFADQEFKSVAFRLDDLSRPNEPLDIILEPGCVVRTRIDCDSAHSSTDAHGYLSFSIRPRPDIPDFHPAVLVDRLSSEDLTSGKPIEVRLPGGRYILGLVCYTKEGRHLGEAERAVVVPPGERTLDVAALRAEPSRHQKMAGKPALEIESTDRDTGQRVRLADFRGKVVVLDFWGYWCGPCIGTMPYLADLHRRFEGRPLVVVALHDQSVQSRADYDRRTAFARKYFWDGQDLPFRVLFDRPDPGKSADRDPEGTGITCKRYEIAAFPTLFVIDQRGTLIATVSPTDHERLETLINKLLDQSSSRASK